MFVSPLRWKMFMWLALAVVAGALTGCATPTVIPKWKLPATQIVHNSTTIVNGSLDDRTPDAVIYNNLRYVVYSGKTISNTDYELFLQVFNVNGQYDFFANPPALGGSNDGPGSHIQLTFNDGHDYNPRLTSDGLGNLFIAWEYEFSPADHDVFWMKVRASDGVILLGPVGVSTTGSYEYEPKLVTNNTYSMLVWESQSPTNTVAYGQVNNSTGTVLTQTNVAIGTNCPANGFPMYFAQRDPQITRSDGGGYAQVVWEGEVDGIGSDGIYWREFNTSTSAPSSNCFVLSAGVSGTGGDDADPHTTINSANRSFVTWTRNDGVQTDVLMRSITFGYAICGAYRSTHISTTTDFAPTIAAGHVVSDWVHLAWERTAPENGIMYQLLDTSDCSTSNTPVVAVSSLISVSTSPVPAGHDVDSPSIAARPNAVIITTPGANANFNLTPAAVAHLAESGHISAAEATQVLADGTVTAAEANDLLTAWLAGQAQRRTEAPTLAPQANGLDQEPVISGGAMPDCAALPEDEKCAWAAQQWQGAVAPAQVAANQCGTNAADAVVISFFNDSANSLYAAYFQAGEALYNGTCYVAAFFNANTTYLVRPNISGVGDRNDHLALIDSGGLATVVWAGNVPASGDYPANDEIFFTSSQYPVMLPLIQK